MGSVAEEIVQRSAGPVLLVHADMHDLPAGAGEFADRAGSGS